MSIPFSIVVIKTCVNSMFWYISITVCFASWCCIDMSISIAKTCGQVLSQLFTHICIDAMSFFSIEIAILTCESCRVCHNPTDFIFRTTAEEAEVTVPSFTEFMVYTKVKFTTCFRFQIAVAIKAIEQLVWCRSQEVLFICSIYICFCIYIIA